jgi:hypothetical protein
MFLDKGSSILRVGKYCSEPNCFRVHMASAGNSCYLQWIPEEVQVLRTFCEIQMTGIVFVKEWEGRESAGRKCIPTLDHLLDLPLVFIFLKTHHSHYPIE